jgi:hypothetical protein
MPDAADSPRRLKSDFCCNLNLCCIPEVSQSTGGDKNHMVQDLDSMVN